MSSTQAEQALAAASISRGTPSTAAQQPTPAAKKPPGARQTVATRTRGARRRTEASELPIHPVVALHVARMHALWHDEGHGFSKTAVVCRAWKQASQQAQHLRRCTSFGELKAGRRQGRFDRPHSACFMPDGSIVIADCDNFRLQFWAKRCVGSSLSLLLLVVTRPDPRTPEPRVPEPASPPRPPPCVALRSVDTLCATTTCSAGPPAQPAPTSAAPTYTSSSTVRLLHLSIIIYILVCICVCVCR